MIEAPAAPTDLFRRDDTGCLPLTAVLDRPHSPVRVRDLSAAGASLIVDERVEPGALLTIELFNPTGQFWHRKAIHVLQVEAQPDGTWLVYGTFARPLRREQLHDLLA